MIYFRENLYEGQEIATLGEPWISDPPHTDCFPFEEEFDI